MSRRNAQDKYMAATIIREEMRDTNLVPEPTPVSKQPRVVVRRSEGKRDVRVSPKNQALFLALQIRSTVQA